MTEPETINFTRGVPAIESFPTEELLDAATAVLRRHAAAILQYGPALGFAPLREWLAQWQGVQPEQIFTANGSLQLIEFLCLATLAPDDIVFTESPTYDRTLTLLRRHRARVIGVPLEADGPSIEVLTRELKLHVPKLFYIIPDFQNPAGATCSLEKRQRIIELAERHGFLLLEDAPYRLLRYRGEDQPSLFQLAPHRTVHMTSFTKLIAPGVRLGCMAGDAKLLQKMAKVAEDTYISPAYLAHGIAYEWCRRGFLAQQIEKLKVLYAPRLDACLAAISRDMPEAQTTRPDGGFFVSQWLPEGVLTTAVRAAAAKRHLQLADGTAFFPAGGGERFLRLPFCALTPAQIDEGIRRLAEAVHEVRRA
jgi:DNA-binding transcriptional MocR family regulator